MASSARHSPRTARQGRRSLPLSRSPLVVRAASIPRSERALAKRSLAISNKRGMAAAQHQPSVASTLGEAQSVRGVRAAASRPRRARVRSTLRGARTREARPHCASLYSIVGRHMTLLCQLTAVGLGAARLHQGVRGAEAPRSGGLVAKRPQ